MGRFMVLKYLRRWSSFYFLWNILTNINLFRDLSFFSIYIFFFLNFLNHFWKENEHFYLTRILLFCFWWKEGNIHYSVIITLRLLCLLFERGGFIWRRGKMALLCYFVLWFFVLGTFLHNTKQFLKILSILWKQPICFLMLKTTSKFR